MCLGANVVLLEKTDTLTPRDSAHSGAGHPGRGGQALAAVGDVWEEADVRRAVDEAAARLGGIDCCVNNASVLASHPHILPLSPPVNLSPRWLGPHPAYRMATYWVTDPACIAADRCLQWLGGDGYMKAYLFAHLFADTCVLRILAGANEIMKELVARSL